MKNSWRTLQELPEIGVDVLVLESGVAKIACRSRCDGCHSCPPFVDSDDIWYWDDHLGGDGGGSRIVDADVTHWQPLIPGFKDETH